MPESIVLDASMTASFLISDEYNPKSQKLLENMASLNCCAPAIWLYEIRNTLITSLRRQRFTMNEFSIALIMLDKLPVKIDYNEDLKSALKLAQEHNLSFYDALYLETAIRNNALLASLDRKLIAAAEQENIAYTS